MRGTRVEEGTTDAWDSLRPPVFCCVLLCCAAFCCALCCAAPTPVGPRPSLRQVSDPVQHSEGVNKYTSYRVDVRPPNSDLMTTQAFSAVLRRYSDFLWLHERLQAERAGAIVPPLPEKQPVGRFNPAFVEARRRELERFLRRAAVHPELQDCACLDTFLRADDLTFQAAKNSRGEAVVVLQQQQQQQQQAMMGGSYLQQQPQLQPQYHHNHPPQMMMNSTMMMGGGARPKKEGFKRWFAETKTSISGDLVRSPDDELFDEIQRYIHGLDTQMKNVSTQASGLVRKGKEMANGLFEFGLAFNLLGQSEADALGEALCRLGETADQLSVLSAEHSDQEALQFEDPLVDMIKTIHSVKLALHKRHEKRLTYSTCLQEVESKQTQLAKLRAQIGMEAKAYAAEMSLRRAQEAAEVARDDFAAVSQRVLREVDRFKRETTEDMRLTVLEYIRMQVDYNKKMEQIWATLIPQLERVHLDPNANVVVGETAGGAGPGSTIGGAPAPSSSTGEHQPQLAVAEPQIHSQPMINSMPNPQQPYMQATPNPFMQRSMAGPPQPPMGVPQDPAMLSVQYREAPSGAF
jgi:sorting nexin-1/2